MFNYKTTIVKMERKICSTIRKAHPYTAMRNSVITTVVHGQKSGLWNVLWHVKTDDINTYGVTVTPLHGNAASVQLRHSLPLGIFWE